MESSKFELIGGTLSWSCRAAGASVEDVATCVYLTGLRRPKR